MLLLFMYFLTVSLRWFSMNWLSQFFFESVIWWGSEGFRAPRARSDEPSVYTPVSEHNIIAMILLWKHPVSLFTDICCLVRDNQMTCMQMDPEPALQGEDQNKKGIFFPVKIFFFSKIQIKNLDRNIVTVSEIKMNLEAIVSHPCWYQVNHHLNRL